MFSRFAVDLIKTKFIENLHHEKFFNFFLRFSLFHEFFVFFNCLPFLKNSIFPHYSSLLN